MPRLNNCKSIAYIAMTCLIVLFSMIHTSKAIGQSDLEIKNDIKKTMAAFYFSADSKPIFDKLDAFLLAKRQFNNEEYMESIKGLGFDFAQSVKDVNVCMQTAMDCEKEYSAAWLKDFLKIFKKEEIRRNEPSIRMMVTAMWMKVHYNACKQFEKEALHKEMLYKQILKTYVKYFLEFSDTLDDKEKEIFKNRIAYAQYIHTLPERSLHELLADGGVYESLYNTAVTIRKDMDPKFLAFFSTYPFFSKPFDGSRVIDEIRKIK